MRSAAGALATVMLGLTAGALLAEAALIIPWWRTLAPQAFFDWYAANTSRLFWFYGPLEAVSAVLVLVTALLVRDRYFVLALVLSLAVLAMFPLYFEGVNASFEAAAVDPGQLATVLARYERCHWLRTLLGIGAFAAAVLGLRARGRAG